MLITTKCLYQVYISKDQQTLNIYFSKTVSLFESKSPVYESCTERWWLCWRMVDLFLNCLYLFKKSNNWSAQPPHLLALWQKQKNLDHQYSGKIKLLDLQWQSSVKKKLIRGLFFQNIHAGGLLDFVSSWSSEVKSKIKAGTWHNLHQLSFCNKAWAIYSRSPKISSGPRCQTAI